MADLLQLVPSDHPSFRLIDLAILFATNQSTNDQVRPLAIFDGAHEAGLWAPLSGPRIRREPDGRSKAPAGRISIEILGNRKMEVYPLVN